MQIRRAEPSDVPALRDIVNAAYAGYAAQGVALPDVAGGLGDNQAAGQLWLAGDPPLGVLAVATTPPHAHLMNVAVAPDAGGKGVGRALILHAVDTARAAGCSELRLTTHRLMPDNVALYEHLGWHVTGDEGDKIFMTRLL
ncbi:hypothetical protein ACMU_13930 [Actibacterium mucosum KCTC 23349]|uniref:N-acetyltransferase domain-containing protein n=1 Tax=Actibacterium mucosum KCTC 23349 TaxID=1454373 RepID=A0A037ZGX7_9RHOB|nr:GNAT family N-acetyltransferase [Actibacterium mucosum]KAJ54859.1 hypothetical protein ACMU_13930 [Actibacterium mucosum KCTC 23349]